MKPPGAMPAPTEPTAAEAVGISVVPALSEKQILEERISALEREKIELTTRETKLTARVSRLTEELKESNAKIHELEKNPFTFALSNLDAGAVLEDAGAQVKDLASKVLAQQDKGKFTLTLTVKPFQDGSLIFVPEVKTTLPKPEPRKCVFYSSEEGDLSRHDPKQKTFGFTNTSDRSGTDSDAYEDERKDPMLR